MEISVVIPAYNEEGNVERLYMELATVLTRMKKSHEILFVDDGSSDGTIEKLEKIAKHDKSVKLVKHGSNKGQTAALLTGFKASKGKIVVSMDADLQNDPSDIPKLVEGLGKADVVCGWRADRKDTSGKRMASKLNNFLVRRFFGLSLHDQGCTLRAYKSSAIKDLELHGEGHRYIPAMLSVKGHKVIEMKVKHHERKSGKTKYGLSRLPKGFLDLITLKFLTSYGSRPIHIFGATGFALMGLGFLGGVKLLYDKYALGQGIGSRPLLILVVLLVLLGMQFIFNGLLAELIIRTRERK